MIFIVVILGGAITGGLTHRVLASIHHDKQTRQKVDAQNIALARDMLADYMLVRSARPFNVARPGGSPIIPRLLMLPCPDNLGDRNLDGSQDPTCGGDIEGVTNGILISGSRFGRLPYRARFLSGGGTNLTSLCQWLDDENADGDSSFIAHPPSTNDFFMFFGGRVRFN